MRGQILNLHFWPLGILFAGIFAFLYPVISQVLPQLGPDVIGSTQDVVVDTVSAVVNRAPENIRNPEFLMFLGLYVDRLAAGLSGGFVRMSRAASRRRRTTPFMWLTGLVVGAVTSNYVALLLTSLWPDLGAGVILLAGFILGYGGEPLLDKLVESSAARLGYEYDDDDVPATKPRDKDEDPIGLGVVVVAPEEDSDLNSPKENTTK